MQILQKPVCGLQLDNTRVVMGAYLHVHVLYSHSEKIIVALQKFHVKVCLIHRCPLN